MDMIRISENKLKLMLSAADMRRYNISGESIDCLDPDVRRALRRLLDDAGRRSGFDAAADRVFVQLYPCRAGGCELFVTRLDGGSAVGDAEEAERGGKLLISRVRGGDDLNGVSKGAVSGSLCNTADIYEFPDLFSLISVCSRLAGSSGAVSSAFSGERGEYYLVIRDDIPRASAASMICGEYDGRKRSDAAPEYIAEHCACICSGTAIESLAALA